MDVSKNPSQHLPAFSQVASLAKMSQVAWIKRSVTCELPTMAAHINGVQPFLGSNNDRLVCRDELDTTTSTGVLVWPHQSSIRKSGYNAYLCIFYNYIILITNYYLWQKMGVRWCIYIYVSDNSMFRHYEILPVEIQRQCSLHASHVQVSMYMT